MRASTALLSVLVFAASSASGARSQDVAAALRAGEGAAKAILAGDQETQSPAVCDVLESGIVSEIFGVEAAKVTYRPASKYVPQALCTASWDGVEASLTVVSPVFDSSAAAVDGLESAVARLEEGFTVSVGGRERTTQVDFDDWMEGVGDRAAWAPKLSELSVAANGVRFAVAVRGLGDGPANRDKAVELAKRLASVL